jgi:predicted metal-dependent TIM-barrel fold hydrolase
MRKTLTKLTLTLATFGLVACASTPAQRHARQKSLAAVVSRVDVARLLDCARHGISKDTARCLGARALTEGLEEAIHQASTLAETARIAGNPQAGAGDMDAEQEAVLAADLDTALEHLALEIAKSNGIG